MCPMDVRRAVWHRLAGDMRPAHLKTIAREITMEDLPGAFDTLLKGEARGRFVVKIQKD
jgi:NADPH-dependent curcumin reductase CurA